MLHDGGERAMIIEAPCRDEAVTIGARVYVITRARVALRVPDANSMLLLPRV